MPNQMRLAGLCFLFGIFIPIVFGTAGYVCVKSIWGKGPSADIKTIMVAPGMGIQATAEMLKYQGVAHYAYGIIAAAILSGQHERLQAGEYEIPPHASAWNIVQKMIRGDVVRHKITLTEGMTSHQITTVINDNEILIGEKILPPPEGTWMPDTYFITRGMPRQALVDRMEKAMNDFIAAEWPKRPADYPLSTPQEWVTLASIVEAETPMAQERAHVAGVYLNRLARSMRLEADPTVVYGIHGGQGMERPLLIKDLGKDTPYNTYTRDGLPPSPINHPSQASLRAALIPEKHDDLFFVADGTGGHIFAKTFDEHKRNVANWRKIQDEMRKASQQQQ